MFCVVLVWEQSQTWSQEKLLLAFRHARSSPHSHEWFGLVYENLIAFSNPASYVLCVKGANFSEKRLSTGVCWACLLFITCLAALPYVQQHSSCLRCSLGSLRIETREIAAPDLLAAHFEASCCSPRNLISFSQHRDASFSASDFTTEPDITLEPHQQDATITLFQTNSDFTVEDAQKYIWSIKTDLAALDWTIDVNLDGGFRNNIDL